ncbi:MAG: hypothetical protein ACYCTE_12050 [Acidimicrobiales bacterium]
MSCHARLSRRGPLAVTALAIALLATSASFALGDTGEVTTSIAARPGLPTNGDVALVDTSIATGVTRTEGNAQRDYGVVLARIEVAPSYAANLRVSVYWTDPEDGYDALDSPDAQIGVGIYHPISTGTCAMSQDEVDYVTVTDGTNQYCSEIDTRATGSANVSPSGELLLARHLPGGYLLPSLPYPTSALECGSPGTPAAWCWPTAIASSTQVTSAGPAVLYVVASVLTPGNAPPGQQSTISHLSFYVDASAQ